MILLEKNCFGRTAIREEKVLNLWISKELNASFSPPSYFQFFHLMALNRSMKGLHFRLVFKCSYVVFLWLNIGF